ncbi:DEAD/DEAH box helicase family protein [Sphingobium sp. LSP13-1-1.1]|uniref:DEAD/DEAH box helicase family protein n=1 Tax=Sphingobium sp. LSP13-1-1.1 TaxID=3135234 RepID=UPI00343B7CFF
MKTIQYVSAPAGSGKTHQLVHHAIAEAQQGHKYLIAQPTIELIDQTRTKIKKAGFGKVTSIYKRFDFDAVAPRITQHISQAIPDEGEILLITHEALRLLKDRGHFRHWYLVVDEFMSVFKHIPMPIAKTHQIVTDHLELSEALSDKVSALLPKTPIELDRLIANPTNDMNVENFIPLLRPIQNDDEKVYVNTESYLDLINNPDTDGHMDFFAILEPTFVADFKEVTFLGANAECTEMFILWQNLFDVDWQVNSNLAQGFLYTKHVSGPRLTISYLFDTNWSKRHANKQDDEGTTLDKLRDFISDYCANERFLWHANASVKDTFFEAKDRLPSVAHGLDKPDYRSCNRVVLISALNRRDAAYKFLEDIGITAEQSHSMISYQADYQAMMRCSLRDDKAIAPVEVIVASKGNAEWLKERFPGCSIRKLEHNIAGAGKRGRPKMERPKTSTERSRERRERLKALDDSYKAARK